MKIKLDGGTLIISPETFIAIAGYAATKCFGVKGMASRNMQDGLVQLLRRESLSKGVKVSFSQEELRADIDLHIVVEHGINIPVLCKSIMSEVRYHVERMTGVRVGAVNLFIDSIMAGA